MGRLTAGVLVATVLAACGGRAAAESRPARAAGGGLPLDTSAFIASPDNLARVSHMTSSMVLFMLYHELGHFIVNEYAPPPAPTTDREAFEQARQHEIAADRFATWAMTPPARPAGLPPETFDPAVEPGMPRVIWSVMWWRWAAYRSGRAVDPLDEHMPDEARAHEILCLLAGGEPGRFDRIASQGLPAPRRAGCAAEAAANRERWTSLLAPQVMKPGELDRYQGVVAYREAPEAVANGRMLAMQHQVLEQVASIVGRLRTRPGLVDPWVPGLPAAQMLQEMRRRRQQASLAIEAEPCSENGGFAMNAYFDPEARRLVLCYRFVELFDAWARTIISQTTVGKGLLGPV